MPTYRPSFQDMVDFQNTYGFHEAGGNNYRTRIDSRLMLFDRSPVNDGVPITQYYLSTTCLSEPGIYSPITPGTPLFKSPPGTYHYAKVFSSEGYPNTGNFRWYPYIPSPGMSPPPPSEVFWTPGDTPTKPLHINSLKLPQPLNIHDIIANVRGGRSLLGRTTIVSNNTTAIIEYPIKNINFRDGNLEDQPPRFQVDTGLILTPTFDFRIEARNQLPCLRPGMIGFNEFNSVEIMINIDAYNSGVPDPVTKLVNAIVYQLPRGATTSVLNEIFAV